MKKRSAILLGGIVLLLAFLTALAQHNHHASAYKAVNVGGDTNKCECSKRLER